MALNKHATQSSTMYSGDASRAVDGDTNTVEALWDNGRFSCSHTDEGDLSAWWKVDLGKEVVVSQVNTVKLGFLGPMISDVCDYYIDNFGFPTL